MHQAKLNIVLAGNSTTSQRRSFLKTYFHVRKKSFLQHPQQVMVSSCAVFFYLHSADKKSVQNLYAHLQTYPQTVCIVITDNYSNKQAVTFTKAGAAQVLDAKQLGCKFLYILAKAAITTKREQQEEKNNQDRYKLVSCTTRNMVYEINLQTNYVYRDADQFKQLTGYAKSFLNKGEEFWFSKIHPADLEASSVQFYEAVASTGTQSYSVDYRFMVKSGRYIYLNDCGVIKRDVNGKALTVTGLVRDITQQKEDELQLKNLALIAGGTVNGIVLANREGRIKWVNKSFTAITGYTLEECAGKTPGSLLQGPETDRAVSAKMKEMITKGKGFSETILNYNKSGVPYWNRLEVHPFFNDLDKEINFIGFQKDITVKKKLADEVAVLHEQYAKLFNNNPVGIILWDKQTGCIEQVNEQACAISHFSKKELIGQSLFSKADSNCLHYKKLRSVYKGFIGMVDNTAFYELRTKQKKLIHLQVYSYELQVNGRPMIISMGTDITKQLQTLKQLHAVKKTEEMNIRKAINEGREKEMAYVGRELHDNVVQLLATCKLYVQMLKPETDENASYAATVLTYLNEAITDIRTLSHSLVPPSLKHNDLSASLQQFAENKPAGEHTRISFVLSQFQEKLYNSHFKVSLYRIIQEQLNNIKKYANASEVRISFGQYKQYFQLNITDNGVGFTKPANKDGIGLQNIAERAKLFLGALTIKSKPGAGVALQVRYPLSAGFWQAAGLPLV